MTLKVSPPHIDTRVSQIIIREVRIHQAEPTEEPTLPDFEKLRMLLKNYEWQNRLIPPRDTNHDMVRFKQMTLANPNGPHVLRRIVTPTTIFRIVDRTVHNSRLIVKLVPADPINGNYYIYTYAENVVPVK